MAEKSTPRQPKLNSALKEDQLTQLLDALDLEHLAQLAHVLSQTHGLSHWMKNTTVRLSAVLQKVFPTLSEVIALDVVLERYAHLSKVEDSTSDVTIDSLMPELQDIYREIVNRINQAPQGIHKAECWLSPIAVQSRTDVGVEAAVYFASRDSADILNADELRDSWHEQVCLEVEVEPFSLDVEQKKRISEQARERATTKTISLIEAADILTEYPFGIERFFAFDDDEEDFIDAAMFRIVEWYKINGFEPWLKALVSDLANGPQEEVEPIDDVYRLFFWCRSNLALSMAGKAGLESWLWALFNGSDEPNKPWRHLDCHQKNPRLRNNVNMAGALHFIWNRIKPFNVSQDILDDATELLFQTQMRSGAWPSYADSGEPNLFATCCVIHGLALHKPTGWERAVRRAGDWLWKQQHPRGYWARADVMLTVLVLDSIALAEGREEVTFVIGTPPPSLELNGKDLENLHLAIVNAYLENELAILLRTKLEEDYYLIVGGQNYSEKVFNLLLWAERHNRVEELIRALASERPKNEILSEYAIKFG